MILKTLWAGLKTVGAVFNVIGMWQRWRQRQEDKQSGRNEQKLADAKNVQKRVETSKRAVRRGRTSRPFRDRVRNHYTEPE